MKVLLIIPAYNEEASILYTIETVRHFNRQNSLQLEYIVINDGSKDRTERILRDNEIPHITHPRNRGIGRAVQSGYRYAAAHGYDIAIQYDGDGQHDARFIMDLIEPIVNGEADLVIGSRYIKGGKYYTNGGLRRAGGRFISLLLYLFCYRAIQDPTSGFRAASADVVRHFAKHYRNPYPEPASLADLIWEGFRIKEVPVAMRKRYGGRSSIRNWRTLYYMYYTTVSIYEESHRKEGAPKTRDTAETVKSGDIQEIADLTENLEIPEPANVSEIPGAADLPTDKEDMQYGQYENSFL